MFPIVEVASTFYRMPDPSTVKEWASRAPPKLTFSLKVPEPITRRPAAPDVGERLAELVKRLEPLRARGSLGTLVAQFPPTFRREKRAADLAHLVGALPKGPRWAIELRHASWWHKDTYALLEDAGVTLVWSSIESGRTPPVVTSDALYLRLFGDRSLEAPHDRKRRDMRVELEHWAARIADEGKRTKRADVLVSKYLEGYAPGSAATMSELLGLPVPEVGPREGKATSPSESKRKATTKTPAKQGAAKRPSAKKAAVKRARR